MIDSTICIENMGAEAVPLIAELERQCFSAPWSEAALAAELRNPAAVFLVARCGGAVAGYAGMHHIIDEGQITNVAVDERFRGRGVGSALVGALCAYAEEHGLRTLTLEVRESNAAAIGLYRKFGFERVGVRPRYYVRPAEDAVLMTKVLFD